MSGASGQVLPVDAENKATIFKPWIFTGVHMRAFHVSWLSFFTSFVSTFAPAALIPVIRDDLDLTSADVAHAGIASIAGNVISRIAMGTFCDTIGPRLGHASLMLLTAPAVFSTGLVTDAAGFIMCRFLIGFSLSTFVACQFWSSVMFNVNIVGTVNATGAGWGNMGGGATQLLMPLLLVAIQSSTPTYTAWRYVLWVPGIMHLVVGFLVLVMAQDLPDGTYFQLRRRGTFKPVNPQTAFLTGVKNYRTWMLTLLYGYSFGVELTMNNIAVPYFFDQFGLSLHSAGILASIFGLLNMFARPLGGAISDYASKKCGMRGRLAALWIIQTVEGLFCIILGLTYRSLSATVILMGCASMLVNAAEGACYGIVPFVSKRALGVVTGVVGAGGNLGSVVLQAMFFRGERLETHEGISLMGLFVIVMTLLVIPIYFPMWGGIFWKPRDGATEEDYYLAEYTDDEIAQGMAHRSLAFANAAITERGLHNIPAQELKKIRSLAKSISDQSRVSI